MNYVNNTIYNVNQDYSTSAINNNGNLDSANRLSQEDRLRQQHFMMAHGSSVAADQVRKSQNPYTMGSQSQNPHNMGSQIHPYQNLGLSNNQYGNAGQGPTNPALHTDEN